MVGVPVLQEQKPADLSIVQKQKPTNVPIPQEQKTGRPVD